MTGNILDTKMIVEMLLGDDQEINISGDRFDFKSTKYLWQDWQKSFDHKWLILKGIVSSSFKGDYNLWESLNNTIQRANTQYRIRINNIPDLDENSVKKLKTNPQRCDMISEIAFLIFSIIKKEAKINEIGHAFINRPNCTNSNFIFFEQAAFVSLTPQDHQTTSENNLYFTELGIEDLSNFYGWRDSIQINDKLNLKSGVNSLCHFPSFFSHPDASMITALFKDETIYSSSDNSAEKDKPIIFFMENGFFPYLEQYKQRQQQKDYPLLLIWLGLGPKHVGFASSTEYEDNLHLMATFWACRLYTKEIENVKKIINAVHQQIDSIRYRMLLGFSKELISEVESKHADLEQKHSELQRQKREMDAIVKKHEKIKKPLRILLSNIVETQKEARSIQGVIDPEGAFFSSQAKIGDLLDEKGEIGNPYLSGLPVKIPRAHQPYNWNEGEQKWIAAKIAYLLCGDEKSLMTYTCPDEALRNAWEEMTNPYIKAKDKDIVHQRIRVWINPKHFGKEHLFCEYDKFIKEYSLDNALSAIKRNFHDFYKAPIENSSVFHIHNIAAFMAVVNFGDLELKGKINYNHSTFPLISFGNLIEVVSSIVYLRMTTTVYRENEENISNLKPIITFTNEDNLDIVLNFKLGFLDNDPSRINNLFESLKKAQDSSNNYSSIGNMTKLLTYFDRHTSHEYNLDIKKEPSQNIITFEWQNSDNIVVMEVKLSLPGIFISIKP
jgi:hypothetical protein